MLCMPALPRAAPFRPRSAFSRSAYHKDVRIITSSTTRTGLEHGRFGTPNIHSASWGLWSRASDRLALDFTTLVIPCLSVLTYPPHLPPATQQSRNVIPVRLHPHDKNSCARNTRRLRGKVGTDDVMDRPLRT